MVVWEGCDPVHIVSVWNVHYADASSTDHSLVTQDGPEMAKLPGILVRQGVGSVAIMNGRLVVAGRNRNHMKSLYKISLTGGNRPTGDIERQDF